MPNSEELLAIRNESIKNQEEALEIIENAIKEYSTLYYNEYLNKMLENDASFHSMSNLIVIFSDENKIKSISYGEGEEFFKWCLDITNNNIQERVLVMYIKNVHNETNPIITTTSPIRDKEDEAKKGIMYICPSYIKELAEKDNLHFDVMGPNKKEEIDVTSYIISANVPKLRIPTPKDITTRSEELDQIRKDAIEEYQEQFARERNIIEKHLLENSIDYYTRVLYSNLKSNVENDSNLKIDSYTVKESGIIINYDDDITESTFETLTKDFKILKADGIMKYIVIDSNPIIYCQREDDSWIVRLNYLRELAEKDGLSFSVDSTYDEEINYTLTKQNLKKLELPKHIVLTLED